MRFCLGGWQVLCSLLIVDDAGTTQEVLSSLVDTDLSVGLMQVEGEHLKKACVQPRFGAGRIPL